MDCDIWKSDDPVFWEIHNSLDKRNFDRDPNKRKKDEQAQLMSHKTDGRETQNKRE